MISSKKPEKLFFVLAHGRSGTQFLSHLLDTDPQAVVLHEPYDGDLDYFPYSLQPSYRSVIDGYLTERFDTILRGLPPGIKIYGEVNSLLRHHAAWLNENLHPYMIPLVRDGRDVVRSMYSRNVYSIPSKFIPAYPQDGDPYSATWKDMSRFERLCWYWQYSNNSLSRQVSNLVRFEDIIADYGAVKEKILNPTGLTVSRETWEKKIKSKKNATNTGGIRGWIKRRVMKKEALPGQLSHWRKWSPEMTNTFWTICGTTMKNMGYDRNTPDTERDR